MGRPLLFFLLLLSGTIVGQDSLRTHFGPLPTLPDTGGTLSFMVSPGELGVSHTTDGSRSTWMGGLQAGVRIHHNRWDLDAQWETVRGPGTFYRRAMESGWNRRTASGLGASRWRGRWTWSPLQSVDVIIGRDTLSEGWGVRSLFRGRHAAPAPFAQFAVDGGGRLRYRHRVEALQGSPHIDCWTGAVGDPRTWVPPVGRLRSGIERMLVSHRVEVDFGTRLTGALWGGVVWNVEDGRRAFEPHYLLPLTSLRPTEYAQGSSDNALVGLEGRIKLGSDWARRPRTLYGQFLLDELIVSELLGGTQWWGNKFALLGGIRWDTAGAAGGGKCPQPGPGPTATTRARPPTCTATRPSPIPSAPTSSRPCGKGIGNPTHGKSTPASPPPSGATTPRATRRPAPCPRWATSGGQRTPTPGSTVGIGGARWPSWMWAAP